jgi:hypothetical protein
MRLIALSALASLALLHLPPAQAGSATAGSILSKQAAIAIATSSMPAGNSVTGSRCATMVRALSARYSCTVWWSPAALTGDG